ncbi:Crp/Fnr family transcriptional regulator [Blastomonas sp.]|uniref:Crp/Fnr family transcriptional regulator n=1 Tax=Blastomonas sp. TaxID=1909299 RepID=UPI00359349A9
MSAQANTLKAMSGFVRETGSPVKIRRHAYIVRSGERTKALLLIQEGWAARYRLLADGRRHISQFYMPGDLCDLSWLVSDEAKQSVTALTPIKAVAIERNVVEERLGTDAAFSRCVAVDSLLRLESQAEWMVTLGCRSALERVAQLICELYLRIERSGRAANSECDFPLSQQDLADFTGMSAVHVCRTLRLMKDVQLLQLHRRRLKIPDFSSLASSCAFNGAYLGEAFYPPARAITALT